MKQKLLFPLPLVAEIEVTYTPKFPSDWQTLSTSDNVAKLLINAFRPETFCLQEAMYCLYLNRANKPLGIAQISLGGYTGTVADVRLILTIALKSGCCAFVLCHNHPSGNLRPSMADEDLTQKIKGAAKLMDITLLDHLILSHEGYFSFADEGIL